MNNSNSHLCSWKLSKSMKKSIYDKKKCIEQFDPTRLYGFIENSLGISYLGNSKYDYLSQALPTELDQMKMYRNRLNKKTNKFDTSFHLPKHKWGRIMPSNNLSLSIYPRGTRHAFCDGYYKDIDMVNAQPTLVYEMCKKHNLFNECMENYIKNPTDCRKEIMKHHNCDKDIAKELPIRLMMGGTYKGWLEDNEMTSTKLQSIVDIETFMKSIIEVVYASNKHIEIDVLKQNATKWKSDDEKKRGVMGLWCQTYERIIQETCLKHLADLNKIVLEETVPCQDGFLITTGNYYESICADLSRLVFEMYDIRLDWAVKEFDEKIVIPSCKPVHDLNEWNDLLSAKCMANRFSLEFKQFIVKTAQNEIFVYWGDYKQKEVSNGRWFNETQKCNRNKLYLFISETLYTILRDEILDCVALSTQDTTALLATLRRVCSSSFNIDDIIKHVISKLDTCLFEFDSKPFLLGFNNGVFDLVGDGFREYKYCDYMTITVKYDYVPVDYNIAKNVNLKEQLVTILEDVHGDKEILKLNLQILASGLDGMAYQKLFMFNGQGGNGKGLTGSLMKCVLGNYYHTPNNGILKEVEKANAASPDIMNLKNKRYINFQEVEGVVKSAIINKFTGGGCLTGRYLQCNPEEFSLNSTTVMEFNNPYELEGKIGAAEQRRMVDVHFSTNFVEEGNEKIGTTVGSVTYKKGNVYFQTSEFLAEMRPIFLDMLLGVYEMYRNKSQNTGIIFDIPQSVKDRTSQFLENQSLFLKIFNNHYVITTDLTKKQTAKQIWGVISWDDEHKRIPHNIRKQYSCSEFYKWCWEYLKASDDTAGKVLTIRGVELKEPEEE